MAKFACDWCGKCCASFGEFIRIERQMTGRDYYCRFGITGEVFPVHVQPEYADAIEEDFLSSGTGNAPARKGCIFMRPNPAGKGFACAIYPTRPRICREFRCYRMLIRHTESGGIRGKVIGAGELRTKDEALAAIWMEKIAPLPHPFAGQGSQIPAGHAGHPSGNHLPAQLRHTGQGDDKEWVSKVAAILAAHGYHAEAVE